MAIQDFPDGIHKDTHIYGDNVYYGHGQGCRTVWYPTVAQARKVIKALGYAPDGTQSGLCEQCSCHYSSFTEEYRKYPEFACQEWKESVAKRTEVNSVSLPQRVA